MRIFDQEQTSFTCYQCGKSGPMGYASSEDGVCIFCNADEDYDDREEDFIFDEY